MLSWLGQLQLPEQILGGGVIQELLQCSAVEAGGISLGDQMHQRGGRLLLILESQPHCLLLPWLELAQTLLALLDEESIERALERALRFERHRLLVEQQSSRKQLLDPQAQRRGQLGIGWACLIG